jgi:hypothetical protein
MTLLDITNRVFSSFVDVRQNRVVNVMADARSGDDWCVTHSTTWVFLKFSRMTFWV